jgi:hypothetical protein
MSKTLDSLVSSGTITSEQKDKIVSTLQTLLQNQTSADNKTDPLESLVTDGTITKDQQSAIKSALEADRGAHSMPPPEQTSVDSQLNSVGAGSSTDTSDNSLEGQQDTLASIFQSALMAYQQQSYSIEDLFNNGYNVEL